jgi:hypothetical protein
MSSTNCFASSYGKGLKTNPNDDLWHLTRERIRLDHLQCSGVPLRFFHVQIALQDWI